LGHEKRLNYIYKSIPYLTVNTVIITKKEGISVFRELITVYCESSLKLVITTFGPTVELRELKLV